MKLVVERASVEVADLAASTATTAGLKEVVGPLATTGEAEPERERLPANPLRLVSFTVEVAEFPACMVSVDGLAEMLKSTTNMMAEAWRSSNPDVALTMMK